MITKKYTVDEMKTMLYCGYDFYLVVEDFGLDLQLDYFLFRFPLSDQNIFYIRTKQLGLFLDFCSRDRKFELDVDGNFKDVYIRLGVED